MRIVHAHSEPRPVGGTETYLLALVEAQRAAGHEVLVAHPATPPRDLFAFEPDVVHVHRSPLSPAVEAELARRAPVVRSLHDFAFGCASGHRWFRGGAVCTRAHGTGCLAGILVRGCAHRRDPRPALAEHRAVGGRLAQLGDAAAVVAYSEFVRGLAVASGVPAERCTVIPYFASLPAAVPPLPDRRTLAFLGRIERDKGLDVLLHALARVPDGWDELVVAGDGRERTACERLAEELGIAAGVRFVGWTDAAGTAAALDAARVAVLPSRWPEPFGIAGLEAGARGRAVVASSVGGIPEWLEDGANGLLVPPGDASALADALGALLADPARAAELGAEGRRRAGALGASRHVAALDAVYAARAGEVRRAA